MPPAKVADMGTEDTYPLRRSFLEQRLGQAVGLVQFNAQDLSDRVSASTLAGAVISAADAPIGTLEFDALTVLALEYAEHGDRKTATLETRLGTVLRKLGITQGTWQRRDLAIALKRLYDVSLELPEYDEHGNETGVRLRRLFVELAIHADSKTLRGIEDDPDADRALIDGPTGTGVETRANDGRVSRLVRIADADEARTEVVFAPWFAEAIDDRRGRTFDLDTQRALDGIAKRVWVTLGMLPYVQAIDGEYESHELELNDRVFEALKLRAARPTDNRKALAAALAKILDRDPCHRRLEIVKPRPGQYLLVIERFTGAARQQALRDRQRQRSATGSAMAA